MTKTPINRRMDKIVMHAYDRIPPGDKKEQTMTTDIVWEETRKR